MTDPDPAALVLALEQLALSSEERRRLSAVAVEAAREEFNPSVLQSEFRETLEKAVVSCDASRKAVGKLV